jgi:hypothetical protein
VAETDDQPDEHVARETPRAEWPERQERTERAPREERRERPRRDERRPRDRDDDGPTPKGLGDHVPSFMLRSVKLPPKSPEPEEAETAHETED